jgi:hypothetical protein
MSYQVVSGSSVPIPCICQEEKYDELRVDWRCSDQLVFKEDTVYIVVFQADDALSQMKMKIMILFC